MAAIMGPGAPISVSQDSLWKGLGKTNGILMRNVDGRIPALVSGYSRIDTNQTTNVQAPYGALAWGNGLWMDFAQIQTSPGAVLSNKGGAKSVLCGVIPFNQGIQTGHPQLGWGLQDFMRGDMVKSGYVGYKVTMTMGASPADYLAYLMGDKTKDIPAVREVWDNWTAQIQVGSSDVMSLYFENTSGFPVMVYHNETAKPAIPGYSCLGDVIIYESENEAVFVYAAPVMNDRLR